MQASATEESVRNLFHSALLSSTLTPVDSSGTILRSARTALGLSTRELARLAGVSYPTISRIENGHEQPLWDTVSKLATVLGLALGPVVGAQRAPQIVSLADQWSRDQTGEAQPNWTRWRAFADQLTLRPELTALAIETEALPTGSLFIDNLLAAMAEKLADDATIRRPSWTVRVGPLPIPWRSPGTPRKQAENAARTPPQFAVRNITLPGSAIWRDPAITP